MSFHAVKAEAIHRGAQNALQSNTLVAPVGGMDARAPIFNNSPNLVRYAYNILPSELGLRTRKGYRDYQVDIETAPGLGLGVRTVLPFYDDSRSPVTDKLFATTNEGIWDVTVDGGAPILKLAFANTGAESGWGITTHFTTDADEDILFVADRENGLFEYDAGTDDWTQAAGITGPVVTEIVFVMLFKQRIWLIEQNSTIGWYLPVGAKSGIAKPFYFGSLFKHGGNLVGLYTWTLDSGTGVDDKLVAISRGGDIVPYQGEDPAFASSWESIGAFCAGQIPKGQRIAHGYGGDLHILTDLGLVMMSDLVAGRVGLTSENPLSLKMSAFLRTDMAAFGDADGWEIAEDPSESTYLICTPVRANGIHIQYALSLSVGGWAFWRDVPLVTIAPWHRRMMIGTADNRVLRMDVDVDNKTAANTAGDAIDFSFLSSSMDFDSPGKFKYGEFIRPSFQSVVLPGVTTRFLYDFNEAPLGIPGNPNPVPGAVWDTGLWDTAMWTENLEQQVFGMVGSWGCGRTMAIAMRGKSTTRATLINYDVMWRDAGPF